MSEQPALPVTVLRSGLGFDDLHRSLLTILCFCDSKSSERGRIKITQEMLHHLALAEIILYLFFLRVKMDRFRAQIQANYSLGIWINMPLIIINSYLKLEISSQRVSVYTSLKCFLYKQETTGQGLEQPNTTSRLTLLWEGHWSKILPEVPSKWNYSLHLWYDANKQYYRHKWGI